MKAAWRTPAIVAILAFLGWIGFEIARAGSDIAVQRTQQPSTLTTGTVNGKRMFDGRSWTLDYDRVTMSADGTEAHIAHVRNGRLHRAGKADVLMTADDVQVNTATNDLDVGGRVTFSEPLADDRTRTFATTGARYIGSTRTLTIDHPVTITEAGATLVVANLEVDFRTGDTKLGRIEGTMPGVPK